MRVEKRDNCSGINSGSHNISFHSYSYNENVITKLFSSGFLIALKGGYK